jgi:hypothetical protein
MGSHDERKRMKLQLWTTVNGEANDLLGEVDVDDEEWHDAQADGGDAIQLIRDLATEIDGGCS